MKCRKLFRENDNSRTVVWFKSHGVDYVESTRPFTKTSHIPSNNICFIPATAVQETDTSLIIKFRFHVESTRQSFTVLQLMIKTSSSLTEMASQSLVTYIQVDQVSIPYDNTFTITIDKDDSRLDGPLFLQTLLAPHPTTASTDYSVYFYEAKAKKVNDNFSYEKEGVADSLTQRLNVIQGELWYKIDEGLPLFEKGTSSTSYDAFIIETITAHPDVVSIKSFTSNTSGHDYTFKVKVETRFGEIELSN